MNIHKEYHKKLEDTKYNNGAGIDEATNIQHFKSSFKSDANLEIAIIQLRSQSGISHSFTAVSTFLSVESEHKQIWYLQLKSSSARQISKFEKSTQKGPTKIVGGQKVFAKYYCKDEFDAFSKEQHSAVISLNRKKIEDW